MRHASPIMTLAVFLTSCATTPPPAAPGISLVVWPKEGRCHYADPNRSTARTIKFVRLDSPVSGPSPTRSTYATDWSEPFDMPAEQGYCIAMARDVRAIAFEPAILFGFEMQRMGAREVEITPRLVHVRRPTVARGSDGRAAFSAEFTIEAGRGGGNSASSTLDLGRVGVTPAEDFRSAVRLTWPAEYSRMRVRFEESTQ